MIGKSLANGFQYTKLKYKQYLQFKYTTYVSFMFLFIHIIYLPLLLFCLLKLVRFSKFKSFLPNLLSGEHHKAVYPPYSRNCQVLQKKQETKQLFCHSLQLKDCAHLLVDNPHYWLFKFLVEVRFLAGTQISSRSLVNINCSEEIYPALLRQ